MVQKACIFDLDGVITDTAHYHFLAWQRLAHSLGLPFDEDDNHRLKGVGRMESLDYILAKGTTAYSMDERLALAQQKNEDYKTLIGGITPADILPGIVEALDWLKANNWRIGLASASRNAPQVLASLEITGAFDYVADAGAIPKGKPAPDIFLDVARAFGLPSSQCLGVEDAASGVAAIKAADMFAAGIGDADILAQADIVLPSPEGLVEKVLKPF
ncbi:beta-phosphoglucomutase [Kordiimonas lacus]|uniref:Beta-phosphoglucomutase n=1 Tax=Kordiimonas lacus TaxID=637679 RepID=A0A1G6U8K5_9PROT|nr:beta-phosphoglucomutase [Kordiimonas lacus]SDD36875.1 beta-phosphoglucomutase [Kordiimonas lacus]